MPTTLKAMRKTPGRAFAMDGGHQLLYLVVAGMILGGWVPTCLRYRATGRNPYLQATPSHRDPLGRSPGHTSAETVIRLKRAQGGIAFKES